MNMRAMLPGLLALAAAAAPAQDADGLRNWYNDPFFQISSALPDCPLPAGPFVDERERQAQAHHRAEKGTSCWLAGACQRQSAYAYDEDIAAAIRDAVRERDPFPASTLWVTVQGRVVYIEGCAAPGTDVRTLESFVRSLPHVEQAIAAIRTDPAEAPPYRLRRPR
jgi:hypothetical protein